MGAVLLDRDGVINEDRPDYVRSWTDFRFLPNALDALAAMSRLGLRLAVVTNQSAVGRGLVTHDELDAIHQRMLEQCGRSGAAIERVFVCPHAPAEGCSCRKPEPGLFTQALAALNERTDGSIAVGDSIDDLLAAKAAGVAFVLVRTGRGEQALRHPACLAHPPAFVAGDLWEVAQALPGHFDLTRMVAGT